MLECERAMGLLRGREIQELVKSATGDICPCKKGQMCPLLSASIDRPEEVRLPEQR